MSGENFTKINLYICGFCNENQSKYCCPRCEMFYCSLDCYKSEKHLQCSESFYEDCVSHALLSQDTEDESRSKMIDILKRMQDYDNIDIEDLIEYDDPLDSDDDTGVDLECRLKDLNLDDPDAVWNALTGDERNEFEALLNQGDVGSILPQWEPWWMYYKERKMVEELNKDDSEVDALKKCPELKKVQTFESLTTVKPSPTIKNNIFNVITAYAFMMRYFNGEIEPVEGTTYLLNICGNLDGDTNFEDIAIAVESVAQKCLQSELIQTDEASLSVMKNDTFLLIQGPSEENCKYYCKAALSDLHHIFSHAKISKGTSSRDSSNTNCDTSNMIGDSNNINSDSSNINHDTSNINNKTAFSRKFPDHGKAHLPNLDVSKVKKCIKKIEYYLSYVESFDVDFE